MSNYTELPEFRSVQHRGLETKFVGVPRRISNTDDPKLIQFSGIKYGNIPARFIQATLNESFPEVYNATKYGPKCPQVILPVGLEDSLIGAPRKDAENTFDEFECLNLSIITPRDAREGSNYPVMIYIHGGGGHYGSNSEWFCDGGPLVGLSQQMGKPVIHVSINYRLWVFGQIGSTELQAVNGKVNGGNFAYHDMHLAIEWVSRHIAPFGGNPEEITIYGESFGSIGVETLLHSTLPQRFARCILQSEVIDAPLFGNPESWATKDAVFQKLKGTLSVNTVKEMQDVPTQALLDAWTVSEPRAGGMPSVPMIDDVLLSQDWRDRHNLARDGPVKVMIGSTAAEGAVVRLVTDSAPKIPPPPTRVLTDALESVVDKEKLESLQKAYQILDSPDVSLAQLKTNIITLIEDVMWYLPTAKTIARMNNNPHGNKSSNVYQYTFNQPNPFDGPFKGVPAHALDLAYLHGDPSIFHGTANAEAELNIGTLMKKYWVLFANGEEPWAKDMVLQIGPGSVQELDGETYLKSRRSENWRALEALAFDEQATVASIVLGHAAQLSSVE